MNKGDEKMSYQTMSHEELSSLLKELKEQYKEIQDQHLNLNMARGKPEKMIIVIMES